MSAAWFSLSLQPAPRLYQNVADLLGPAVAKLVLVGLSHLRPVEVLMMDRRDAGGVHPRLVIAGRCQCSLTPRTARVRTGPASSPCFIWAACFASDSTSSLAAFPEKHDALVGRAFAQFVHGAGVVEDQRHFERVLQPDFRRLEVDVGFARHFVDQLGGRRQEARMIDQVGRQFQRAAAVVVVGAAGPSASYRRALRRRGWIRRNPWRRPSPRRRWRLRRCASRWRRRPRRARSSSRRAVLDSSE